MSNAALRPSFWMDLREAPDRAIARLESGLARGGYPVLAQRAGRHVTLRVAPAIRHFWSPWLNLEFMPPPESPPSPPEPAKAERAPEPGTVPLPHAVVHGRFSPAPSIWTGFMLIYIALATLGLFAMMYAAAQWMLESPPTMLWVALGCLLVWSGLWWVAWLGQKLAGDQMVLLREVLETELSPFPGG